MLQRNSNPAPRRTERDNWAASGPSAPCASPTTVQNSTWHMPEQRLEPTSNPQPARVFARQNSTALRPLPQGVPMDVDRAQQTPFKCYKCGKPGHMARNCNSRMDMRQRCNMHIEELTEYVRSMNEESSKDAGNQDLLA